MRGRGRDWGGDWGGDWGVGTGGEGATYQCHPARRCHEGTHVGSLCCKALLLLPVLAKPSMARPCARMLRPSPNTRLTAQDKGSAKVRRRRAAEAQIGMRGNLTRLLPPRLQLPRLLRQHLPLRYLLPRHLLPPRLLSRALLAASLLVPGLVSGCDTVSNISSNLFGSSGPARGPARPCPRLPGRRGRG